MKLTKEDIADITRIELAYKNGVKSLVSQALLSWQKKEIAKRCETYDVPTLLRIIRKLQRK